MPLHSLGLIFIYPAYIFFIDYEGKGIFTKADLPTGAKIPDGVINRATNKK